MVKKIVIYLSKHVRVIVKFFKDGHVEITVEGPPFGEHNLAIETASSL